MVVRDLLYSIFSLQRQVLAKLVGKPDASDSELHSVVFEKVSKDPARMQAIKE